MSDCSRLFVGLLVVVGSAACAPGLRPLAAPATAVRNAPAAESGTPAPASAGRAAPGPLGTSSGVLDMREYEGDARVARYVSLFSGGARESFAAQLDRGTRYEAMIRARLRGAGLPESLYYLALVESGFEPQATSRVSAVGIWQFMAGTARELGLRVDWWVDERRDPVRATDAAARNLRWLRTEFGATLLAVAAYNGGPTRVARGLARLASDDSVRAIAARSVLGDSSLGTDAHAGGDARYFALSSAGYLRPETVNYVPQLIAATMIAREPARYGIVVHPQPPFSYDSLPVDPLTPLAAIAAAAAATREEILELNPHLLRGMTPPLTASTVRVPVGRSAATARALDQLPSTARRAFRDVAAGKHETLAMVAERESVPLRVLQRYNPSAATIQRGTYVGHLVTGQGLRVPTPAVLAFARDVADADTARLTGLPTLAPHVATADAPDSAKPRGTVDRATTEKTTRSTGRAKTVPPRPSKMAPKRSVRARPAPGR